MIHSMATPGDNSTEPAREPPADHFHPPSIPTEVQCMCCYREFDSWKMEWHEEYRDGEIQGFWCCPTEGCSGRGFGLDIWPTEPHYIDPDGRDLRPGPFDDSEEDLAFLEDPWTEDDDFCGFDEPPAE
jgi:hypothetical protein